MESLNYTSCLPISVLTEGMTVCSREYNTNKEESREQRELREDILVEMWDFSFSFRLLLSHRWLQPGRNAKNMERPVLLYVDAG